MPVTHRRPCRDHYLDVKMISDTSVTELSLYPHDEAIEKRIDPRDNTGFEKEKHGAQTAGANWRCGVATNQVEVIDKNPRWVYVSISLYPRSKSG